MSDPVLQTIPLGFQWATVDPFLFCVHHLDRYPEAKIIAMSGWQSQRGPDYLAVAREIGAVGTLRKPFEPRELLRLVRRIGAEG